MEKQESTELAELIYKEEFAEVFTMAEKIRLDFLESIKSTLDNEESN